MQTNLQVAIEKERAAYIGLNASPLRELCDIHGLSVRDFARIFGISRSHAHEVIWMTRHPDLRTAFRIARYFECTIDELWGWMFDDDGARRPLVIELPNKQLVRLHASRKSDKALEILKAILAQRRKRM